MNPEMLRKLKLMQEKMGGAGATGGSPTSMIASSIGSMIPDVQQNEVIKGKTGVGGQAEALAQQGIDMLLPGAGAVLGATSKIGNVVAGDGTSGGKNLVEELINPLANINDLAEGRAKYAIPIVGSFLKANDSKNKLAFDKQKQDASLIDQARQRGAAYPSTGVTGVTRFELGGSIPLSNDSKLLQGNTHEQGGIPITKQGNQIAEAENNEVMVNTPNATHIASDKVINPKTGNSFAIDIAMTKKKQSKYEKLAKLRKGDDSITNVINKGKKETEALMQGQEQVKQQMLAAQQPQQMPQGQPQQGIPMEGQPMQMSQQGQMPMMKYGGTIGDGSGMSMEMKRKAEEAKRLEMLGINPMALNPTVTSTAANVATGTDWGSNGDWGTTENTNSQKVSKNSMLENGDWSFTEAEEKAAKQKTGNINTLDWNPYKAKVMDVQLPVEAEPQGKLPAYVKSTFKIPEDINTVIEEGRGYSLGSGQEWDKKPNKMVAMNTASTNTGELLPRTPETIQNIGKSLKPFADKLNNIPADIMMGAMNAFDRRKDKAPQEQLMNYLSPQKVDYGSQRTEAQRQALGTRRALATSTTDSTSARASTLAALSEQINGVNRVNEAETNMNAQIMQEVLGKNNQIQGLNNKTTFNNEVLGQQFKDDKRAKNLQLASRIANESSQRKRDANADKLANTQNKLAILAQDNPNVIISGIESGLITPESTGMTKEELNSLKEKYKKMLADSRGSSTTTETN